MTFIAFTPLLVALVPLPFIIRTLRGLAARQRYVLAGVRK